MQHSSDKEDYQQASSQRNVKHVYGADALRELEEYLDPNVLNDEEFID